MKLKVIEFIGLYKIEFVVLALIFAVLINLLLRWKLFAKELEKLVDDTLKVYDPACECRRYSGTKLTMVTAFGSVVWCFHYIIVKYGFNETAFITMAAIATGVGIAKAYSKKVDPEVSAPDSKVTFKEETDKGSTESSIKTETTV